MPSSAVLAEAHVDCTVATVRWVMQVPQDMALGRSKLHAVSISCLTVMSDISSAAISVFAFVLSNYETWRTQTAVRVAGAAGISRVPEDISSQCNCQV